MSKALPRTTVTARIKLEVRSAIHQVAAAKKLTPSQLVEHALIAWLASQQDQQKAA